MSNAEAIVVLKPGREKPVHLRHPWLFSGALAQISANAGDLVTVLGSDGAFLARGDYNPASQLRLRLFSWLEDEVIDEAFWRARLAAAIARRDALVLPPATDCVRLVFGEADQLPGLIVDRYGDYLAVQALTLGMSQRLPMIVKLLAELLQPAGIYERSDEDVRALEGLPSNTGVVYGQAPPQPLVIQEHGHRYHCDLLAGHKTGFYLDQRDNRQLVQSLAQGRRVLNCFSYTGAFTVAAIAGGAVSTCSVEASAEAQALARQNLDANGFAGRGAADELVQGNVFSVLRGFRADNRQFDLIILDPPKFASSAQQVERAARGYKDINLLAAQLLAPGGLLLTFSCSGAISPDLFQKIVFGAISDAGRQMQLLRPLTQAPDHPVLMSYPESAYLKGLLLRAHA